MSGRGKAACVGMCVLDVLVKGLGKIPQKGQTAFVDTVTMSSGGDAANQAVVLAALGHEAALLTLLGSDGAGKYLSTALKEKGVNTEKISFRADVDTSTSVVLIDENGERSFLSFQTGSVDRFGRRDINLRAISEDTEVVSVGSLFCSPEFDRAGVLPVLLRAKEMQAVTVADFVPNRKEASLEELAEVLSLLDYAIPSYEEAKLFTGKEIPAEMADVFLSYGVGTVIIKLGADGVYAKNKDEEWTVPAFHVKAMDTTGAGDNFVAGFICGILEKQSLEACLRTGCAAAAISIGSLGACTGVTSREQVQCFLEENQ